MAELNDSNNTLCNRVFEEQFHEQTVNKNRVDGTVLSTFCTDFCARTE